MQRSRSLSLHLAANAASADILVATTTTQIYFTISKRLKFLSLPDIIIYITASYCPLLHYLILISKIHIWDCRRKGVSPNLEGFKLKIKYQTENYVSTKNNDLETYRKWTEFSTLIVFILIVI